MTIEQLIDQHIEAKVKPLLEKIADLEKRLSKTDVWVSLSEAAELSGLHIDTLYRKIHGGALAEGTEWRRKPGCKKGYQIEKSYAESCCKLKDSKKTV